MIECSVPVWALAAPTWLPLKRVPVRSPPTVPARSVLALSPRFPPMPRCTAQPSSKHVKYQVPRSRFTDLSPLPILLTDPILKPWTPSRLPLENLMSRWIERTSVCPR